jgi:hypothetical protein
MKVILDISLQRPFGRSLDHLLEMATIWSCDLHRISPKRPTQTIAVPFINFRKVWGFNPKKGFCPIPQGTEDFISDIQIVEVRG